jgi:prepilin-type N-terminal cleavage/methylation domain-containing protein
MSMRRIRRGFTLLEIIASLLLFAMGMMAIIGVIVFGMRSAMRAQADATAWATALSVLKDPVPQGGASDVRTGTLALWTWNHGGATWTADDGSGQPAWQYTSWPIEQASDVLVADMADPVASNPAYFPPGSPPATGCARGWLNGYYVERREQSRARDRLGPNTRIVEVRVDVYWAAYGSGGDGRPLATLVDRVVRQGNL